MKGSQNLRVLQQQKQEAEGWVAEQECAICNKMLKGAYGHTVLGERVVWSCSGACEKEVQQLRKGFYASIFQRKAATAEPVGS